jgi:hypothetical protein
MDIPDSQAGKVEICNHCSNQIPIPSPPPTESDTESRKSSWEIRKLFGRVKIAFCPRMHECQEDVEMSEIFGRIIINFCGEYAYEIGCAYGEMLKRLQREVDTVYIAVAGPSLGTGWPAEVYEPEASANGRSYVIAIYMQAMGRMAAAFARTHPGEAKDDIFIFSMGLIFFQMVHLGVEDDEDIIAEQSRELSDMLGSELGAWIVNTDDEE